jgi:hypothetical protein
VATALYNVTQAIYADYEYAYTEAQSAHYYTGLIIPAIVAGQWNLATTYLGEGFKHLEQAVNRMLGRYGSSFPEYNIVYAFTAIGEYYFTYPITDNGDGTLTDRATNFKWRTMLSPYALTYVDICNAWAKDSFKGRAETIAYIDRMRQLIWTEPFNVIWASRPEGG